MEVIEAIKKRRSFRAINSVVITKDLIDNLAQAAQLAPSCNNKQPWRYIFVYKKELLEKLHGALSKGNDWANTASLIIVVCCQRQNDCISDNREYYLFDTGIATGLLMLRATDLGFVAHPIAGYDEGKVKEILKIPPDVTAITLIILGRHEEYFEKRLTGWQLENEKIRPARLSIDKFAFIDYYKVEN
jgi:nitroreductase